MWSQSLIKIRFRNLFSWFIADRRVFRYRSQNDLKHFKNGSLTQRFLPVLHPTLPFDHQLFSAHHELFSVCVQKTLIFWYFCIFIFSTSKFKKGGFFSFYWPWVWLEKNTYSSQEVLHGRTTHDITNCTCPELQLRPHTTFS